MEHEKLSGGYIFDIQGFSVHDGPGCRTLVFFKGCSLNCVWCSNPEGIFPKPQLLYNASKCIFDGLCAEACPENAISLLPPGNNPDQSEQVLFLDRSKCLTCATFDCIPACCTGAMNLGGYKIQVDALFKTITRDRRYWGNRGGITITGGEPFFQPEFARELLQRCYSAYIHTAAETCGNIPWQNIAPSLPYLDWIFFDLKHMDPLRHRQMTRATNHLILKNGSRIAKEFTGRLVFRMPLIRGFNDDATNISAMISFIQSTGRNEINILPGHHLGREKYALLGMPYYTENFQDPGQEILQDIKARFDESGIHCYLGNNTPF